MAASELKVSVIIPVYNTEKYLRQCIDSVIDQTLKEIEIICINDASSDNSLKILKELSDEDKRISIIDNQEKGGAGKARNQGLQKAQGEYIFFVDADDFMKFNLLEQTYKKIKSTNADICILGAIGYDEALKVESAVCANDAIYDILQDYHEVKEVFNFVDMPRCIFDAFRTAPWNKLFNHQFIIEHHLLFQEIENCNDVAFCLSALAVAERIVICDMGLYYYRFNNGTSLTDQKKLGRNCLLPAFMETKEYLLRCKRGNLVEKSFLNTALKHAISNLLLMVGEAQKRFYDLLREEYFVKLGLLNKAEDYFYDQYEYRKMRYIIQYEYHTQIFNQYVLQYNFYDFLEANQATAINFFSQLKLHKYRVALWGAGKNGVDLLRWCGIHDFSVGFVVDNEENKQGKQAYGITINNFQDISEQVDLVITTNPLYFRDINFHVKELNKKIQVIDISVFIIYVNDDRLDKNKKQGMMIR